MQSINIQRKDTISTLQSRVRKILLLKGFSFLYTDIEFYNYFCMCKKEFNPALSIAQKFITENTDQKSDFSDYIH